MRQIGNIPNMEQALTLADYLLGLQIETRLEQEPDGGWAIWVCDEDRLGRAREELAAFRAAPTAERFVEGARAERARRRAQPPTEEPEEPVAPAEIGPGMKPVTLGVVLLTVVLALLSVTDAGTEKGRLKALPADFVLTAQNDPTLPEVRAGQVWRLVTPALLHLSFTHWLFNVLWLVNLGGQVEDRRGPARYVGLLVGLAVFSNLAQFYLGHPELEGGQLRLIVSASFGGLSGVVYGLFGYVWIKGRFEPDLGLSVPPPVATILLVWLVFCFTGVGRAVIGPVANAAHLAGLLAGLAFGGAPALWRRLRGR